MTLANDLRAARALIDTPEKFKAMHGSSSAALYEACPAQGPQGRRSVMECVWEKEPDHKAWESSGLPCRIVRHPSLKHLCGYVGVPPDHPLHGLHYDAAYEMIPDEQDPHGGLTYARDHVPNERSTEHWWFGFDCAHSGDLIPGSDMDPHFDPERERYRDMAYVTRETEKLAAALKDQSDD